MARGARISRGSLSELGLGFAMLAVSCSPAAHDTPLAAFLYVTGNPVTADRSIELLLIGSDKQTEGRRSFRAGERIVAQVGVLPGSYTVAAANGACSIEVTLAGGDETDLVLELPDGGACRLRSAGSHVAGEGGHPFFGSLVATLAGSAAAEGATLRVRSLDAPPNPVPSPVAADPDNADRFSVDGLPPGRYEAQVARAGRLLGTAAFEVGTTGRTAEVRIEIPTRR